MSETIQLQGIDHSRKKEGTASMSFSRFLKELYPSCKGNSVGGFIHTIVSDLEPILEKNPLNLTTFPNPGESYLGIRGSSIKRANLGTPPGYWQMAKIYESELSMDSPIIQTTDPLVHEVAKNLSTGAQDLDLLFLPKEDLTALDIFNGAVTSLRSQGFYIEDQKDDGVILSKIGKRVREPYDDYIAKINYKEIGGLNTNPVKAISLEFDYWGKKIMKVDLIQAPREDDVFNNFRLSGCVSGSDLLSFGYIKKDALNKVRVSYETDLVQGLDAPQFFTQQYQHSTDLYLNSFNARIRALYQRTMWFHNFKEDNNMSFGNYSTSSLLDQLAQSGQTHYPLQMNIWIDNLNSPEKLHQLETRLPDIITGLMVGLTYDPFLFLKLAMEAKVLRYLPISDLIKNQGDFLNVMGAMAKLYEMDEEYYFDPAKALPRLSKQYQEGIFRGYQFYDTLKRTGPFILLKALNQFLIDSGREPIEESLTSIVDLLNPLTFYKQYKSKGQWVDFGSISVFQE